MESIFQTIPGMETTVSYMTYETNNEAVIGESYFLDATFTYKHGTVTVSQRLLDDQTSWQILYWGGYAEKISRKKHDYV